MKNQKGYLFVLFDKCMIGKELKLGESKKTVLRIQDFKNG